MCFRTTERALAVFEFKKAVALNPNFTDHRFGAALVYAGEAMMAMQVLAFEMRLIPIAPAFCGAYNTCPLTANAAGT